MSSRGLRKLIPLFDRVLVKRVKVEQAPKKVGSVFIPESASKQKEENPSAEVVAIGAGIEGNGLTLKVGDKVLLPAFTGVPVRFEGEEYDMYREDEILAKIE